MAVLDFRIILEARNPARGCLRHYRLEAGTDLFGTWVVVISYGRIGTVAARGATSFAMKRRPATWHRAS